ncbi:hypothetical protein [Pseudomonas sp. LF245]
MKLTYSNQLDGFDPDERYRNPEHFDKPEAGVTSVLVIGDWPKVVDAYESVGVDVSVKEGARVQVVGTDNQAELERLIAGLRAENNAIVFLVDGLKSGEVVRPDSGELAICLFDAFESAHTALGELTKARDDLASTVGELRGEIEALKKAAGAQTADEAGEIAALKAKLDEAKVPYRSNASKESLEKLVADLSKE